MFSPVRQITSARNSGAVASQFFSLAHIVISCIFSTHLTPSANHLTDIIVLFPFHIPVPVPRVLSNAFIDTLARLRIISPRNTTPPPPTLSSPPSRFVVVRFPLNFVTAPVIADLFLLVILAIGRKEVHDGIVGSDNIAPYDVMIFFLTLAYIAISVDASGLIRYLACKVLQWGGEVGHRLFFYLYAFFFALGACIGNDPIILSGTAFLAYMTRVSSNIVHPRAWIHTQFAIANIASAILVSSNPTNLVLAGAFNIKFIVYTANMIVPVIVTVIVLFPFLLYIVFANESLIPVSIQMHQLSEEAKARKPVNPNIPHARGTAAEEEQLLASKDQTQLLSLEEIMNPFLDKSGAAFGVIVMATTLITLLVLNAVSSSSGEHPVFWVTLPAAVVMFSWDLTFGWMKRQETREIARKGRIEVKRARAERIIREEEDARHGLVEETSDPLVGGDGQGIGLKTLGASPHQHPPALVVCETDDQGTLIISAGVQEEPSDDLKSNDANIEKPGPVPADDDLTPHKPQHSVTAPPTPGILAEPVAPNDLTNTTIKERDERIQHEVDKALRQEHTADPTLASLLEGAHRWCQETFPTVTAVAAHLPFALVPFAFAMFILVQALVTKGWVQVFALGWERWVRRTGTVGAVGGMGFLSVVLCNVSNPPTNLSFPSIQPLSFPSCPD